jgi:alpha-galactosidase
MHLVNLAAFASAATAATVRTSAPQMGWNSYNYYSCSPTEKIMKENAQGLVDSGLAALGYKYVTTDCGWMSKNRDGNGRLQWDPNRFPAGGKALGEFFHSLGLKFGVYSGGGYYQCGSKDLPASLGMKDTSPGPSPSLEARH